MKQEDRYRRFKQWSEEDRCYIGYCPDLYLGGVCHAATEIEAYSRLCEIVHDEVAHRLATALSDTLAPRHDFFPSEKAAYSLDAMLSGGVYEACQ